MHEFCESDPCGRQPTVHTVRMRNPIRLPSLVFMLLVLAGCASLGPYRDPPRVSLVNVVPMEMTLFEQRYRLTLRIQNPNNADLPVEGMAYTVEINDRKFADGVSNQHFDVPAYGEQVIDVVVTSTLLNVLQQVRDQQSGSLDKVGWKLSGGLSVPGYFGKLSFEYAGSLDLAAPARTSQ